MFGFFNRKLDLFVCKFAFINYTSYICKQNNFINILKLFCILPLIIQYLLWMLLVV